MRKKSFVITFKLIFVLLDLTLKFLGYLFAYTYYTYVHVYKFMPQDS